MYSASGCRPFVELVVADRHAPRSPSRCRTRDRPCPQYWVNQSVPWNISPASISNWLPPSSRMASISVLRRDTPPWIGASRCAAGHRLDPCVVVVGMDNTELVGLGAGRVGELDAGAEPRQRASTYGHAADECATRDLCHSLLTSRMLLVAGARRADECGAGAAAWHDLFGVGMRERPVHHTTGWCRSGDKGGEVLSNLPELTQATDFLFPLGV